MAKRWNFADQLKAKMDLEAIYKRLERINRIRSIRSNRICRGK